MSVIAVFLMAYLNTGLMIVVAFHNDDFLPQHFTPRWLVFFGKMVKTSLIVSNLLHLAGPVFTIILRRGCLCCKRKNYKPH